MNRIVIVSGPPGAGKTTVARRLSQQVAAPLAMHMHTDDIYGYITKGFVAPWLAESRAQNVTLMTALATSAGICAKGGYEVFVDGIVGPWFFDPWTATAQANGLELHYVVLMPDLATTVARATARTAPGAMNDAGVASRMWRRLEAERPAPAHVIDTTLQTPAETVGAVFEALAEGRLRMV